MKFYISAFANSTSLPQTHINLEFASNIILLNPRHIFPIKRNIPFLPNPNPNTPPSTLNFLPIIRNMRTSKNNNRTSTKL